MEAENQLNLREPAAQLIEKFAGDTEHISEEKKSRLDDLAIYVSSKLKSKNVVKILLTCTFDNNLTEIARVWAQIATLHQRLDQIKIFSAGINGHKITTDAIKTLEKYGFDVKKEKSGPAFVVKFSENYPAIKLFSKDVRDPENPDSDFVAVILTHITEPSPIIIGADFRLPLFYESQKPAKGNTDYAGITEEIARDMFYIFSRVRKLL